MFPITRQALQDIAQILLAGGALFLVLAFVTRQRGGSPRRNLMAAGMIGGLVVVCYALAFTVAPDIPTPPVPFTARFQQNPVPDTKENIDAGRVAFQTNCAICHGPRALGDGPAAFALQPRPFNLQVHAPLHPTGEVYYWISSGVAGTAMPAWGNKLTETERWQIIRYIDALAARRITE